MTGRVHVVLTDRSPESGSVVSCTCGLSLGPFDDPDKARAAARHHREATAPPTPPPTEEQRARARAWQQERRAARRAG